MKKQDLINLKKKVTELSVVEKKERDIYLRDIATDKILGPQVGYPEIGKLWLQYYDLNKSINHIDMTVYESLVYHNQNHLSEEAIEYFGAKISYKKLFYMIESVAKS